MTEYRWAEAADYMNIIDEANHAFDTANYTGDFQKDTGTQSYFPRILPKLYQNPRIAPMHVLAVQDGRICALVGLFELPYVVGGMPLKVRGIGTVSVRPGYRNEGHMKELMARAVARAKEEDADYMVLGGRRQRYGHWGFEQAGALASFMVDTANIRHTYGKDADFGFRFRKLTEADTDALAKERALRTAAAVHMEHPEDEEFMILCSMGAVPYLIEKDGAFAGTFMYFEGDRKVCDLRMTDKSEAGHAANDLLKAFGSEEIEFTHFGPDEKEMTEIFSALAESCRIEHTAMMKILNYERVLKAYFGLAAELRTLADGEFTAAFENGERLKIAVRNGAPEVTRFDGTPDLTLTEKEAVEVMFHPHAFLHSFGKKLPGNTAAWFPLPFYENMSDEI